MTVSYDIGLRHVRSRKQDFIARNCCQLFMNMPLVTYMYFVLPGMGTG